MTINSETRAGDLVRLVRRLTALDVAEREGAADDARHRTHSGAFVDVQRTLLGQLCVWAWIVEREPDVAEALLWAVGTLAWHIEPSQVAGVAQALSGLDATDAAEDFLEDLNDYLRRDPEAGPHLLRPDACRRAVDLARGITSAGARERLDAARLSADVVASRTLTDDEAGCFAGLLSYAVVIESDPAVRHEQATVLGVAAHHGRLSEAHREVARAADLTDAERSGLDGRP